MNNRQKLELLKEKKRREKMAAYSKEFASYAGDNIKIITKDATEGFIHFKLNEAQTIINEQLEKQLAETGKVRAIILKARQQGISTYSAARCFWKSYFNPNSRAVVMAHDAPTSSALFDMTRNLIDHMEDDMRPKYAKSNAKEMKFEHNNAQYKLYTAGSPQAGRGTTSTILHASEVAFWQHDAEILAGLFQGISQAPGTEVILESTANGASGEFYRLWKGAVAGENGYIPVFIPWFVTSEYRTPIPSQYNLELTTEEEKLIEDHDLDLEQIYWRRLKIAESGARKFQQEYPAVPEEAFLVSGTHVFDPKVTHDMVSEAPIRKSLYNDQMGCFDEDKEGHLQVWQAPNFHDRYVIGADISMGAQQDYSVATVFNDKQEMVAMLRTNIIDPGTFGDILFYLGRYYNNALLCVESNSIGNTTLDRLRQMQYVNLYFESKVAAMRTEETEKLGFRTTSASKPRIIGHLKRCVEDLDIRVPAVEAIQELCDYIQTEGGKTEALAGSHDDIIMAMAISMEVLRTHRDRLTADRVPWTQKIGNLGNYNNDQTNWM